MLVGEFQHIHANICSAYKQNSRLDLLTAMKHFFFKPLLNLFPQYGYKSRL